MNRSVTIYKCDRCRVEVEVRDDRKSAEPPVPPKGWTRVTCEPMNGDTQALAPAYDLCGPCFTEHLLRVLRPVERVRDMQADVPREVAQAAPNLPD